MVKVYYHDNKDTDFTLPHEGASVSLEELQKIGVFYRKVDEDGLNSIAKERNYKNRDVVEISESSFPSKQAFENKLATFYSEHFHEDEEIRYIVSGSGYFDVRSVSDSWIRTELSPGDLLILPAGIYHRFTLTSSKYVKAVRLFKDEPKWEALNRSENIVSVARTEYVESIKA